MAMYWTCEYGCNHDFGEKCDCLKEQEKSREAEKEKLEDILTVEPGTNQIRMIWEPWNHERAI